MHPTHVAALYACKALACITLRGLSYDDVERQNLCGRTQEPYGRLSGKTEFAGLILEPKDRAERKGKRKVLHYDFTNATARCPGTTRSQTSSTWC